MAGSDIEYDVVIVGAGPSGALIAHECVKAGYSVLMLEAGPDKTTMKDRNLLVENFYKAEQKTPESPYPPVLAAPKATTADLYEVPYKGYLDQQDSSKFASPDVERLYQKANAAACGGPPLSAAEKDELGKLSNVRNDWFKSTYERRVGGTLWHWLGTSLRLVPGDFEMVTRFKGEAYYERLKQAGGEKGLAMAKEFPLPDGFVDWPFDYETLRPWYTRAEAEMGISGDPKLNLGGATRKRPDGTYDPYPMPVVPPSWGDKVVAKYADGQPVVEPDDWVVNGQPNWLAGFKGFEMEVQSTPQGRNSVGGYQGRPQCCGNCSCIPICPVQAKYDASVHVNMCRDHYGKLFKLEAQSVAYEVLLDQNTNTNPQVTGIRYKRWTGSDDKITSTTDFVARGRIYVIAAHAIETPKLLLNSKGGPGIWGQRGVANSSDAVGRYLMDHNTSLSFALACEPMGPVRGPVSTSGIESLKDNNARGFAGTFRVEIGNLGWEWPDDAPFTQVYNQARTGKYGKQLKETLHNQVIRQFRFGALVEPTPMWDHRVTLSDSLDALGIPRPKTAYGISDDPYCIRGYVNSLRVHQRLFGLMKATNINHQPPEQFAGAGHIMGTCRMSDDPSVKSVVNSKQQSHDHDNLYIVGSSVFPTVGASNPTLTIGALSLWAADHIKRQSAGA